MPRSHPKTLIAHITPFLEYCEIEKGLTNTTQKNYSNFLNVFRRWLEGHGRHELLPHELSREDVWAYRLYLAQKHRTKAGNNLSKHTQKLYLSALRALLKYFDDRDIEALPYSKVSLPKHAKPEIVSFLRADEMLAICEIPDTATKIGLRDRAILELFFSSGMRIAELVSLNVDQVRSILTDDPTGTVELPIVGKGKRSRTVFISPRAALWINAYLKTRHDVLAPLFVNYKPGHQEDRRLTDRSMQRLVRRCADLAGINKDITPHSIRHSYATDLLSHGADLRAVQELLGHKNIATTQIYTHVTNKQLKDVHEKHHGGSENNR